MNTIRSILYATDFSSQSEAAFPLASALARDFGARLIIAHVRPVPAVAFTVGNMALIEPEGSAADIRERLGQFDPKDARVVVEYRVAEGDAATEILQIARQTPCDLIVMGTHGRSGFSRLLAGSVAEQVMRYAPCSVMTIRSPAPTEAATKVAPKSEPGPSLSPEEAFVKAPFLP